MNGLHANGDRRRGRLGIPLHGIAVAPASAVEGRGTTLFHASGDRRRGRLGIPLHGTAVVPASTVEGRGTTLFHANSVALPRGLEPLSPP